MKFKIEGKNNSESKTKSLQDYMLSFRFETFAFCSVTSDSHDILPHFQTYGIYMFQKRMKTFYKKDNFNAMIYIPTERKFITVFDYQNKKINEKI